MFTRVGSSAYKEDLTNTIELCKFLNNPQNHFKSVHVGGTNGKGSTSHMLAAILQTAGYKTGLYTSPHLRDFRERIRVNGNMISEEHVVAFTHQLFDKIEEIEPSFFEVTVAMAFDHFRKEKVDIAIIEVGLGGRLDSTNIIDPVLSVITNIGYDHMNILGDTLPQIASEKAGIIKQRKPVVIGQRQPEIENIFIQKAKENNADILFASDEWDISKSESLESESLKVQSLKSKVESQQLLNLKVQAIRHPDDPLSQPTAFPASIQLDLTGTYQLKNLATVLSSVKQLRVCGFNITSEHIQTALKQVTALTGLMGRWQTISTNPFVICDTGHNEDGIKEVLENIRSTSYNHLHMVIGMVKDKDINKVLSLLPSDATYYFCEPEIPRAKTAIELQAEAKTHNLNGNAYATVKQALEAAKKTAHASDLIFVGGSTFVVAEVV
ncbi:MAG: fgs [Sphingobacteriales bacterium]|nr:fgs [Sphingobacteriales bacterium]